MRSLILALLLLPALAWSEPLPIQYTEPASGGATLDKTCVYTCVCLKASVCTCKNWKLEVCMDSDGSGSDVKNPTINVPIYQGDLPVTVRYTVTSVNNDGNETTRGEVGVTDSHTFVAP